MPNKTPQPSDFNSFFDTHSGVKADAYYQNVAAGEIEVKLEQLVAQRYSSDTIDRKWLAVWTAITVTIWLIMVLGIVMQNSAKFFLSDIVLTVLLGTTTLNVLGLSFIVLRGHFQSPGDVEKTGS